MRTRPERKLRHAGLKTRPKAAGAAKRIGALSVLSGDSVFQGFAIFFPVFIPFYGMRTLSISEIKFHFSFKFVYDNMELFFKAVFDRILTERYLAKVLSPNLAVPHIVIEGQKKFEMVIARSRKGVAFSEDAPAITTVFVLLGSQDLRNFYLRVLSAIAHIVQTKDFEEEWNTAKNEQALKDLVVLTQRNR